MEDLGEERGGKMRGKRNAAAGMLVEKQTTQSRGLAGWSVEDTVTALPVLRRLSQSSSSVSNIILISAKSLACVIIGKKNTCQIFYQQMIYCRVFFRTLKRKTLSKLRTVKN